MACRTGRRLPPACPPALIRQRHRSSVAGRGRSVHGGATPPSAPDASLGGNYCTAPRANLREALGGKGLPPDAWHEALRIENRLNRILLYKADLVHPASGYFGFDHPENRVTAVFFWMA